MHKTSYLLSIVLQFLKLQTNESYARGKLTMKETAVSNNFMTLFAHWDKQFAVFSKYKYPKKAFAIWSISPLYSFLLIYDKCL